MDELITSYHNGNFSEVKRGLINNKITFSEFFDYYVGMHSGKDILDDLKLFVYRLSE